MQANTIEEAIALTKKFTSKPSNEELLKIYALYKQASEGDNETERPGGFDFKAAAKYNAWLAQAGKSKSDASQEYIAFINEIAPKYL